MAAQPGRAKSQDSERYCGELWPGVTVSQQTLLGATASKEAWPAGVTGRRRGQAGPSHWAKSQGSERIGGDVRPGVTVSEETWPAGVTGRCRGKAGREGSVGLLGDAAGTRYEWTRYVNHEKGKEGFIRARMNRQSLSILEWVSFGLVCVQPSGLSPSSSKLKHVSWRPIRRRITSCVVLLFS